MDYDCLIVDDEAELGKATAEYFTMFDIPTKWVAGCTECLTFLAEHVVKVILLDINLDEESGFELCKELRESTMIPILFISARQSDDDVLIALNIGGDDYIKKPYSLSVLLAKVKIVIRRTSTGSANTKKVCGEYTIDEDAMCVLREGRDCGLKNKEFKLFCYLYEHPDKVITKDELFKEIWGDQFFSDGTLNVHIRKLREKTEADPNHPKHIKTIWGVGYKFEN